MYYILFFIDLSSRCVHIAGVTAHPESAWVMQVARNVMDLEDAVLRGKRYLILDRDAKYSDEFRGVLTCEGVHVIRLSDPIAEPKRICGTICALD
jgi:putative transposase